MKDDDIHQVIRVLEKEVERWKVPVVGVVARESGSPFQVLISCILSLRTKDATTEAATRRLFALARTPRGMLKLPVAGIAKAIYPVGFYRTKARTIRTLCQALVERHGGRVPDTIEGLLALKGVGRKTANLVVTLGYGKPGICVDIHVHRISNRWGYLRTKTPEQTEMVLRRKLPRRYWLIYNDLLVTFGQNLCVPVSPWCSRCPLLRICDQSGVARSR